MQHYSCDMSVQINIKLLIFAVIVNIEICDCCFIFISGEYNLYCIHKRPANMTEIEFNDLMSIILMKLGSFSGCHSDGFVFCVGYNQWSP